MIPLPVRWRQLAEVIRHLRYDRVSFRSIPMVDITNDQADAGEAVRWLGPIAIDGPPLDALFCHPASTVTYRIRAASGDRISAGCALLPEAWEKRKGGVEFSITVTADSGRATTRSLVAAPRDPWRRLSVPVANVASGFSRTNDDVVTVTLATSLPAGADASYAWAIWGEPRLDRLRKGPAQPGVLRALASRIVKQGVSQGLRSLYADSRRDATKAQYQAWFERHAAAHAASEAPAAGPLISILTPAFNTPPALLHACIASVLAQTYTHWEWCLCNDASTSADTVAVLRAQTDPRIRVIDLAQNAGIALATQAALDAATGDFVALLDSDDELTPDALQQMVRRIADSPSADILYSDEDKRDEDEGLSEPFFKPDWSPDHLLSAMYTCHLTVARRELTLRAGGFRKECEGSQDHDLFLRMSELTDRIEHVPRILYHWRRAPMSGATKAGSKPWAEDAGRLAVANHLERRRLPADVVSGGVPGLYRPRVAIAGDPAVLVFVLGDDAAQTGTCVSRIRAVTRHEHYDIIVTLPVSAEINALVRQSTAAHVAFVDSALDVGEDWLTSLLEFSQLAPIGAAGGKVHYADGRLRHIGLLLGTGGAGGGVARAMHQHPGTSYGYFSSAIGIRNYSAVSGEFFMTRRAEIEAAGGFDESLPWIGADVAYCLKAQDAGRRVVFTPYALAKIRKGAEPLPAAPPPEAIAALRARWPEAFARDPYANPNLSTRSADYELEP